MGIRTDLAMEAREASRSGELNGVVSETITDDQDITITRVRVINEIGARQLSKPIGSYITIEAPALRQRDAALEERVSHCLSVEGGALLPTIGREVTVLVIGLGNWDITPDSLGPRAVARIMVTRHLMQMIPDQIDERVRSICALSPGVLGITGIETAEIIRGVVERIKPDILIAIDALAARSINRLGTTVQLSDAGIHPGSGVGNHRMALNRETLGIPVLSIGVPLVVYAGTIARDVIETLGGIQESQQIDDAVEQVLHGTDMELMVTPKEVDQLVEDASRIVATGINLMVHRGVTIDEIARFMH